MNSIPRARACGGLVMEVFIPSLHESCLMLNRQFPYTPQLRRRESVRVNELYWL
jgi:hypothetical protein